MIELQFNVKEIHLYNENSSNFTEEGDITGLQYIQQK